VTEAITTAGPWLAGAPVAVVGGGGGGAGPEVREALLDAGAAVATVAVGAPVPPGTRWVVDLSGLPAGPGPGDGHGSDRDDDAEPGLGPDSVVLVAGGGRGIGARTATALARAFGCGVVLVGRSPLRPDGELCHPPGCGTTVAARLAIIGRGELGRPGGIAVARDRILAAREIRRTLADLSEHAAFASYRALDVRDARALAAAIEDIRAEHGGLDGIVRVSEVPQPGRWGAAGVTGAAAGGAGPAADAGTGAAASAVAATRGMRVPGATPAGTRAVGAAPGEVA
jgi:KR domain